MARQLALTHRYDAVICLGAVIRGATPHFDYVSSEVSKGIAAAGFQTGVPVVFGVLTTDTMQQALERAGIKSNLGWEYAMSAIEMASVMRQVRAINPEGNGLPSAAPLSSLKSAQPEKS
jgi:6,7-dimethyl-8-ribityllumazine synthase